MVVAAAAVALFAWAAGQVARPERPGQPGRHQRSSLGPVRGDGSGWTEEGLAMQRGENTPGLFSGAFRGPEDDPRFVAQLAQLNQLNRPDPPEQA